MKLALVQYRCATCAHAFDAPELDPNSYGEFLLRSGFNEMAYLDATRDETYDEVDRLLSQLPRVAGMRTTDRARLLRQVFGELACDPAPSGAAFHLAAQPVCPKCGSHTMASWAFREPPVIVDVALAPVTHDRWRQLPPVDRLAALERVLPSTVAPAAATEPATAVNNAWAALLLGRDDALQQRLHALAGIAHQMTTLQPPFHPGDGLGGAARTLAEALLLFGPARCKAGLDALLPNLPLATQGMDPRQPGRLPTTLGLVGFVLLAQNAGGLPPPAGQAEVTRWLEAVAHRQPAADAAARAQCGALAAAFGLDALARDLLDRPPATFVAGRALAGSLSDTCAYLLDALDAGADFAAIEPAWLGFVAAFPRLLEQNAASWVSMHAVARVALGRVAGVPVAHIATQAHQQVMQAIAA